MRVKLAGTLASGHASRLAELSAQEPRRGQSAHGVIRDNCHEQPRQLLRLDRDGPWLVGAVRTKVTKAEAAGATVHSRSACREKDRPEPRATSSRVGAGLLIPAGRP
jgi:hypothetical protein